MKTISELFKEALDRKNQRGYANLYVVIDLHGTIFEPTKKTMINNGHEETKEICMDGFKTYPFALKTLKSMSSNDLFKIIIWTSSKKNDLGDYMNFLEREGIKIFDINKNPDFIENNYADFSDKFCFDLLIDDKAGFDPWNDWIELYDLLSMTKC